MTTKQNDTVAVADALLDGVSGGALTVFTNIASFTSPRGDDDFNRGLHNNGAIPPVSLGHANPRVSIGYPPEYE